MEQRKYKHLQRGKYQGLSSASFKAILNSTHPVGFLDTRQQHGSLLHTCPDFPAPMHSTQQRGELNAPCSIHAATSHSSRLPPCALCHIAMEAANMDRYRANDQPTLRVQDSGQPTQPRPFSMKRTGYALGLQMFLQGSLPK